MKRKKIYIKIFIIWIVFFQHNKFIIYEPKERQIVSQNMQDKIVNHLVARYILYPALIPCLLDVNVASRKNMGASKGLCKRNLNINFKR